MSLQDALWTGQFARHFRQQGPALRELAAYLVTGPTAVQWGIWRLALDRILGETGRNEADTLKGLASLEMLRFAFYDVPTGWVYVPKMPAFVVPKWPLTYPDNKVIGAKRWYLELADNRFLPDWYDEHLNDLHLQKNPFPVGRRDVTSLEAVALEGLQDLPRPQMETDLFGERPKLVTATRTAPTRHGLSSAELNVWFERICAIYPKRTKLYEGRKALMELRPSAEVMAEIWYALEWQARQPEWIKESGHFAPALSNYFKKERWKDRPPSAVHINEGTARVMTGMADFVMNGPEEPPCRIPPRTVHALPPRSAKSQS